MLKHFMATGLICFLAALSVHAQECAHFLFLQKNKVVEETIYNKKGEPNGKKVYEVSDVSTSGGTTTAKLNSELFDKKGKSIAKSTSSVQCTGGAILIDMKMEMPEQDNQQQTFDVDASAQGNYIDYPYSMKVGDDLKDGTFTLDMKRGSIAQTVNMQITQRKVLAQESITTPAGTWDCFKISSHNHVAIKTGFISIPFNVDVIEWYAPGFGIIKTETKHGTTLITSIK